MKKAKVKVPGLSPVYTIEEVAEILKVDPKTVYRLVDKRELVAFAIGRVYRVEESDLLAFLERAKEKVRKSPRKSY